MKAPKKLVTFLKKNPDCLKYFQFLQTQLDNDVKVYKKRIIKYKEEISSLQKQLKKALAEQSNGRNGVGKDVGNHYNNKVEGDVESEKEFVEYMHELYHEDWYDICDQLEAADRSALADQISMLFEGDMEIYSSPTDKYATEWFDIGEVDSEYSKYGGFNGRHNTLSE